MLLFTVLKSLESSGRVAGKVGPSGREEEALLCLGKQFWFLQDFLYRAVIRPTIFVFSKLSVLF